MSTDFKATKAFYNKVEELKRKGIRVETRHRRPVVMFMTVSERLHVDEECRNYWKIRESIKEFGSHEGIKKIKFVQKGGRTIVTIKTPNGDSYEAESKCSDSDVFNYKEGRERAFWRAYTKYEKNKNIVAENVNGFIGNIFDKIVGLVKGE